jgi:predicted nucleic acid-binding protein
MIIVDSNFFLGLRDSSDSMHEQCLRLVKKLNGKPILFLEDVLKEVQTVISIRKSHKEAFNWLDSIYKNETNLDRQYNLSSIEYFEVLNYWRSFKKCKLSFVDAQIIYIAIKNGFKVLSFDKELLRYLPAELKLLN